MKAAREVSKFRRVVAVLAWPDPLVYGGMIFGGASPLLSQALPMVDESPFAALPDGAEIPGVAAGGGARRATALGAASAVVAVGKAPGLERRETALAPSQTKASAAPVFSLRRANGGRVEQGQKKPADPFWGPATGSKNSSETRFEEPGTDTGARGGNPWQSGYPWDPGTDRTASEFPAKGAGNPWQSCQSPEGAVADGKLQEGVGLPASGSSGHAAGAALHCAMEEVGRLADALLSDAGGSAGSFAPVGEVSATASGNGELRPQAGVGRLKPAPPLDTALEEVGRLAGALVGGGGESSASFASPGAPAAAASRGGYSAGQTPGFADPDAEWLATLVNEALTEQARRHGVDLS